MEPITSIKEAQTLIDSFQGKAEDFKLPISEQLQDPLELNMATITEIIVGKGWMPDGVKEMDGYRIYKYVSFDE